MASNDPRDETLAINGGQPARQHTDPPMYPGGNLIDDEEEQAVLEVLRAKRLFRYYGPQPGPSKTEQLETEFAAKLGSRYAIAVNSGTSALMCALQGVGIGPGDEVIVPAYTWIASAAAVVAVGGIPVLAEVDESLTLDPHDVERAITPHTRAMLPVHMRGVPCRMDKLVDIAQQHHLSVIEDVAQADGASFHGKHLGTFGDAGCFSFQFNKIITSGEGGMIITDLEELYRRALMFHDVVGGLRGKFPEPDIVWGINFRMPELLAAVMRVQLRRLDGLLAEMRHRKRVLQAGLEEIMQRRDITLQEMPDPQGDASIAQIFFARDATTAQRIVQALRAENVSASVLYHPDVVDYHIYAHWIPIMRQRTWTPEGGPWRWARRDYAYTKDMCPRTLDLLGRAVHLHVNPLLTDQDIEETLDGLNKVLNALA